MSHLYLPPTREWTPQDHQIEVPEVDIKNHIDPRVLRLIATLFPAPPVEGLNILAKLCRLAKVAQLTNEIGETDSIAIISFHGIKALCAMTDWPATYDQTLAVIHILDQLKIIKYFRREGLSHIHIALGKRAPLPSQEELLRLLLASKRRDRKIIRLIERVRICLEMQNGTVFTEPAETTPESNIQSPTFFDYVYVALQNHHISAAKIHKIINILTQQPVKDAMRRYLGVNQQATIAANASFHSDCAGTSVNTSHKTNRHSSDFPQPKSPYLEKMGDFLPTSQIVNQDEKSSQVAVESRQIDDSIVQNRPESPRIAQNRPESPKDDDFGRSSSFESLSFCNSITEEITKLEEPDNNRHPDQIGWTKEDLHALILEYISVLEPRFAHCQNLQDIKDGSKIYNTYQKTLQENYAIARISAVNAVMAKYFYELGGFTKDRGPVRNLGSWFITSYRLYNDPKRKLSLIPEIKAWADTTYSLEQINTYLSMEYHRQRTHWDETFHLPLPECVPLLEGTNGEYEHCLDSAVANDSEELPSHLEVVGRSMALSCSPFEQKLPSEDLDCDFTTKNEGDANGSFLYYAADDTVGWVSVDRATSSMLWFDDHCGDLRNHYEFHICPTQYQRYIIRAVHKHDNTKPYIVFTCFNDFRPKLVSYH